MCSVHCALEVLLQMPPPAWLMLGLALSFMEAIWMGMVLDGHNNNQEKNGCQHPVVTMASDANHSSTYSSSSSLSSWKVQPFSCSTDQVIFVGLDQAETSIVGTIAMNLQQSCRDTHNRHAIDGHVRFTQHQPLSSILRRSDNNSHGDTSTTTTTTTKSPRLVAFLRHPLDRVQADFFRWISVEHLEPTEQLFQRFYYTTEGPLPIVNNVEHYYLRHLSVTPLQENETKSYTSRTRLRTEILNRFDFLGTTERMMESLVVLKMIWNLSSWKDLLHLSPYPTFFLDRTNGTTSCVYQVPFFTNHERQTMLDQARSKRRLSGDLALYAAVDARLDQTIEALGYDEVMIQLQTFQRLLQGAIDECWTSTTFPCSANGDLALHNHSCVLDDMGCGQECLKEYIASVMH